MTKNLANSANIDNAILMCSYNCYGNETKKLIKNQSNSEKNKGKSYINHLILRKNREKIDNVKFNFLLDDVPIMAYSLMNLSKSKIKNISVVGNNDSKRIFNEFVNFYDLNSRYDRFRFIHEGNNLSLSNTIKKGKKKLKLKNNELSLLLPGDIPLFYNIDGAITHHSNLHHDCVLNLNTRNGPGLYFPRNYHLRLTKNNEIYEVKEPNFYLLNLMKIKPSILDTFYGGRKTYSSFKKDNNSIEKGRSYAIKERFLNQGKWKKTLNSLKGDYISFLNTLFTGEPLTLKFRNLENLVDQGLGLKSKIRLDNYDPGTIEDIDSLEDWSYLNQMFIESKKDNNSRHKLYPYYESLNNFKKGPMLDLKDELPIYQNYKEHINHLFQDMGLVDKGYYLDNDSFVLDLPYKSDNLTLNFSKNYVKRMIKDNLRYHQKYFDKILSID